jgi:hypothetical protein
MTSGAIYNAFTSVGITPYVGINIPQIRDLQQQITELNNDITLLNNNLTELQENLYIIQDDSTDDKYKLGVANGELYIQPIEEEEPEEEEEGENG